MATDSPSVPYYSQRLAMTYNNLGNLLSDGRQKEAEPLFRQAIALYEKRIAGSPADRDYRKFLANSRTNLGILLAQMDRTLEAEQEYRRAVPLIEKLAVEDSAVEAYQRDLANSRQMLANFLHRAGRLRESEKEYRQVIGVLSPLVEAGSRNMLAWSLATIPDPRLRDPQRALRVAKKAVEQRPQSGDFRNTLGVAHYRVGEWKAAIEALEKSIMARII